MAILLALLLDTLQKKNLNVLLSCISCLCFVVVCSSVARMAAFHVVAQRQRFFVLLYDIDVTN